MKAYINWMYVVQKPKISSPQIIYIIQESVILNSFLNSQCCHENVREPYCWKENYKQNYMFLV